MAPPACQDEIGSRIPGTFPVASCKVPMYMGAPMTTPKTVGSLAIVFAAALFCLPDSAWAQTSGGTGGAPPPGPGPHQPPPGGGGQDWNPTVLCEPKPGDTLINLFECIADEMRHPEPYCAETFPEG